ncbi:MAG: hypothetical protein H9W81_12650 [Enterococcus sp.]|nr:hypothetical protein [Enterococcus sp.]
MTSPKNLPLTSLFAYHNIKDNTIRLGSTAEPLAALNIVLDKKSPEDSIFRKELKEQGYINKTIGDLLGAFGMLGINEASYDSGLVLTKVSKGERINRARLPEKYLHISSQVVQGGSIYIGIDYTDIGILGLRGAAGSGKSFFIKNRVPEDNSMVLNFSDINYKSMSPIEKQDFGNSISREFLQDKTRDLLVLDHYSISRNPKNLNFHPTLYHETFNQIIKHLNMFKKAGKTLIVSGVDENGELENAKSDAVIDFLGNNNYLNYGFSFDSIDFPKILVD